MVIKYNVVYIIFPEYAKNNILHWLGWKRQILRKTVLNHSRDLSHSGNKKLWNQRNLLQLVQMILVNMEGLKVPKRWEKLLSI